MAAMNDGRGGTREPVDVIGALLVRAGNGDRAAFEQLYQRTSAKLFGLCLRMLIKREEAEEVLQDMYVTVWHRAATFRPDRGNGMAWLIAVTRNRAIDRLRARRPVVSELLALTGDEPDARPLASEQLQETQEHGRLARCLDALAVSDAAMIRTAFFGGASYSDLAGRAALPLGTVKSRIRRALLRLRDCLQ